MSLLARPHWLAGVAVLLAVALHPATHLERWPEARIVVPALALLLVISLVARALAGRLSDRVLALGALVALAALGYDALRGRSGVLTVAIGQGSRSFAEEGPGGRRLGLAPLGFAARLDRADRSGEAVLTVALGEAAQTQIAVGPGHAASFRGVRFGDPQVAPTGGATALRVAVSGPAGVQELTLAPGQVASLAGAEVAIEQYFADFALDVNKKPFSRTSEPRNPAALLDVRRGGREFRVFVLQALPGIHRQEGLDLMFSLVGVEPELAANIRVVESRAALIAAAGVFLVALGLALRLREPA